ncbi:lipin Ned1, partial [Kickxella alabastrina]
WDWGVKITPTPHTGEIAAEPSLAVSNSNDINGVDDKTAADVRQPGVSEQPNKHALDVSALLEAAVTRRSASSSPVLEISLCGIEALQVAVDATYQQRIFDGARVQAQTFEADPIGIITNPSLVFRQVNGEYVQGEALVIALVSQLAFGLPLDRCLQYQQSSVAGGSTSTAAVITLPGLAQQSSQLRVSGASSLEPAAINAASASAERIVAEIDSSSLNIGDELSASSATAAAAATSAASSAASAASKPEGRRWWRWGQRTASTAQPDADSAAGSVAKTLVAEGDPADAVAIRMPLQPVEASDPYSTHDGMSSADEAGGAYMSDDGALVHPVARQRSHQHSLHYAKTLRMTSEQLKSLGLRQGANDIKFLVPSNKAYCEAKLYLYRYDTQIVISDIDGTITKSDALGHLFNMVGKDWTHQGVAKLYTDIANNGYEILYLTSRAIGQADGTRYFLNNVKQGQFKLPGGPLLLSPDRLFTSFHREVIMRRPQ